MNQERWRKLLGEERRRVEAALRRSREELAAEPEELVTVDQHQADAATDLYDREDVEGRIAELEERLAAVARAEERLDEGTYGTSVESGKPIPKTRLETIPTAERTAAEELARRPAAPPAPGADDDTTTPLDASAPPAPDLGAIPIRRGDPVPVVDPQEEDDEIDLPVAGEAYEGEGGAPEVGEPDPDDAVVDRLYRPER